MYISPNEADLYKEAAQDHKFLKTIEKPLKFIKFKQMSIDNGWTYWDEVDWLWKRLINTKKYKYRPFNDAQDAAEEMAYNHNHKDWKLITI